MHKSMIMKVLSRFGSHDLTSKFSLLSALAPERHSASENKLAADFHSIATEIFANEFKQLVFDAMRAHMRATCDARPHQQVDFVYASATYDSPPDPNLNSLTGAMGSNKPSNAGTAIVLYRECSAEGIPYLGISIENLVNMLTKDKKTMPSDEMIEATTHLINKLFSRPKDSGSAYESIRGRGLYILPTCELGEDNLFYKLSPDCKATLPVVHLLNNGESAVLRYRPNIECALNY